MWSLEALKKSDNTLKVLSYTYPCWTNSRSVDLSPLSIFWGHSMSTPPFPPSPCVSHLDAAWAVDATCKAWSHRARQASVSRHIALVNTVVVAIPCVVHWCDVACFGECKKKFRLGVARPLHFKFTFPTNRGDKKLTTMTEWLTSTLINVASPWNVIYITLYHSV